MTTLPSWLLPALASVLVAILLALLTLIINIVRDVAGLQETCRAHSKALECVPELVRTQDRMLFRQETEDKVMLGQARDIAHSPTHPERDKLVDKLLTNEITAPEITELVWRLELMMGQEADATRKLAAGLLLTRAYVVQERFAEQARNGLNEPCRGES